MESQTEDGMIGKMIAFLAENLSDYLVIFMVAAFFAGIAMRVLVWYTVRRELWFAREFSKRVHHFLDEKDDEKIIDNSFFVSIKLILELTYYEIFMLRAIKGRRNPDYIMDISDRVFLIQEGCARLVKECLRQIKHLKYQKERPQFVELTKNVFDNNPCFKKVFGVIPIQSTHDILSILPGIFIIGGIFGTFLGIMDALPKLGGMKLEDAEQANVIMSSFLASISFSMRTSIVGIILSVIMTFINTALDPEKIFMKTVNKFVNSMELLWDCCDNNILPSEIKDFDKHLDPLDGRKLAADDIERQMLAKGKKERVLDIVGAAKEKFKKDYDVNNEAGVSNLVDEETHDDEENKAS